MLADDFRAQCGVIINDLLVQGFRRPISFTAIAGDGLATIGSSESLTLPAAELGVKTDTSHGPFHLYLLPIHCLWVDPQGWAAHALIDASGMASLQILHHGPRGDTTSS
jgi:hypothetical protein